MMIVNYASSIVNKLEALLTDDASVVIYERHVFIVQATEQFLHFLQKRAIPNMFCCNYFNIQSHLDVDVLDILDLIYYYS
jgi:hypothetical protein